MRLAKPYPTWLFRPESILAPHMDPLGKFMIVKGVTTSSASIIRIIPRYHLGSSVSINISINALPGKAMPS